MLDIQFIRDNVELVRTTIANKKTDVDLDKLLQVDAERRKLLTQTEELAQARNELAKAQQGGKPSVEAINQGKQLKTQFEQLSDQLDKLETEYFGLLHKVPNIPSQDTPVGASEADNQVVSSWDDKPKFDFTPLDHVKLGETLGLIDLKRAAKVSGARFAYLMGGLVELQFALMRWTQELLSSEKVLAEIIEVNQLEVLPTPFVPMLPPVMLRTDSYEATARLKAEEVTYKLADDEMWLIGSAEHSMVAMYQGEILDLSSGPIRYLGYSTSFRREAGSYGKDLHGILRMHHFDKLEMESFCTPADGMAEHKFMIAIQEYLMQQLKLHYQVVLKCTADMGDPNARGVDIETWIPSQEAYRETHSADYMADYQARRLKLRLRDSTGKTEYVHTCDATAFAMGRTLIAIMEQYQQADGSIMIPEVLQPYMGQKKAITNQ